MMSSGLAQSRARGAEGRRLQGGVRVPEVPLSRVRHYAFARQNVLPGTQSRDIQEVAHTLVGIHSARMQTPLVALYNRVRDLSHEQFQHEAQVTRRVIKLRCMRRTLHTVPLALAAVVHQATLDLRMAECLRLYRQKGLTAGQALRLEKAILTVLQGEELSASAIEEQVLQRIDGWQGSRYQGARRNAAVAAAIKKLWEEGTLCYLNRSSSWRGEHRCYGITRMHFPELDMNSLPTMEAQVRLVSLYLDGYGPALEEDMQWWSGLRPGLLRKCLASLGEDVTRVRIRGLEGTFLMARTRLDELLDFVPPRAQWLRFLAYEDPSLKGYHASRGRYVRREDYWKLFNPIGEARASIVINGEVVGCWGWSSQRQTVDITLFRALSRREGLLLNESRTHLESFLRTAEEGAVPPPAATVT